MKPRLQAIVVDSLPVERALGDESHDGSKKRELPVPSSADSSKKRANHKESGAGRKKLTLETADAINGMASSLQENTSVMDSMFLFQGES